MVTTLRALQERVPIPQGLAELRMTVAVGDEVPFQELLEKLDHRGFERVPVVEAVGQFAVRGGLVDLFSFGAPEPVRIEFWGDEVVSIRGFDILHTVQSFDVGITTRLDCAPVVAVNGYVESVVCGVLELLCVTDRVPHYFLGHTANIDTSAA